MKDWEKFVYNYLKTKKDKLTTQDEELNYSIDNGRGFKIAYKYSDNIWGKTAEERVKNIWIPLYWDKVKSAPNEKQFFEKKHRVNFGGGISYFDEWTGSGGDKIPDDWREVSYEEAIEHEGRYYLATDLDLDSEEPNTHKTGNKWHRIGKPNGALYKQYFEGLTKDIKETDSFENFQVPENSVIYEKRIGYTRTKQRKAFLSYESIENQLKNLFEKYNLTRHDRGSFWKQRYYYTANVKYTDNEALFARFEHEEEEENRLAEERAREKLRIREEENRRIEEENRRLEEELRISRQRTLRHEQIQARIEGIAGRRRADIQNVPNNGHFSDSETETVTTEYEQDTDAVHPVPRKRHVRKTRRRSTEISGRHLAALRNVFFNSTSETASLESEINRRNNNDNANTNNINNNYDEDVSSAFLSDNDNNRRFTPPRSNHNSDFIEEEEESDLNLLSENSESDVNSRRRTLSSSSSVNNFNTLTELASESDFSDSMREEDNDNTNNSNRLSGNVTIGPVRLANVSIGQGENQSRPANEQRRRRETLHVGEPNHADRNNQIAEAANRDEMARQQVREVNRIVRGFAVRNEKVLETLKKRMSTRMSTSMRGAFGIPGSFNFFENIFASHNDTDDNRQQRHRQRRR